MYGRISVINSRITIRRYNCRKTLRFRSLRARVILESWFTIYILYIYILALVLDLCYANPNRQLYSNEGFFCCCWEGMRGIGVNYIHELSIPGTLWCSLMRHFTKNGSISRLGEVPKGRNQPKKILWKTHKSPGWPAALRHVPLAVIVSILCNECLGSAYWCLIF